MAVTNTTKKHFSHCYCYCALDSSAMRAARAALLVLGALLIAGTSAARGKPVHIRPLSLASVHSRATCLRLLMSSSACPAPSVAPRPLSQVACSSCALQLDLLHDSTRAQVEIPDRVTSGPTQVMILTDENFEENVSRGKWLVKLYVYAPSRAESLPSPAREQAVAA